MRIKPYLLKVIRFSFVIFFIALLSACDNFLGTPVSEYFEYYTSTAAIEECLVEASIGTGNTGIDCVESNEDKNVIFTLRNPKRYTLDLSYTFDDDQISAVAASHPGAVQFVQSSDKALVTMILNRDFLNEVDMGGITDSVTSAIIKNLSGTVNIIESESQRPFDSYHCSVIANSAPPRLRNAMFQADIGATQYIICFDIPNLHGTVHEQDSKKLYVDNELYTLTYTGSTVTISPAPAAGGKLATSFSGLKNFDGTSDPVWSSLSAISGNPENCIALYYETGLVPSAEENANVTKTLTLTDDFGFAQSVTISKNTAQLSQITLNVIEGETYSADDTRGQFDLVINHDRTSKLIGVDEDNNHEPDDGEPAPSAPYIVYEIYKNGVTNPVASGTKRAPVTVPLEKGSYKVKAYAYHVGYVDSKPYDGFASISGSTSLGIKRSRNYYVNNNALITGNGSINNPYRTIQNCIDDIDLVIGAGTPDPAGYNIYLQTNITPASSDTFAAANDNALASFGHTNTKYILDGNGHTINAQRTSTAQGRVLHLKNNVNLVLKNVTVSGGNIDNGAGLNITSGSTLNLESGAFITSNIAQNGGGIYSTGTIKLNGIINVTGNTNSDGTTASNVYMTPGDVFTVLGDLTGSRIGINVPWQPSDSGAPVIGTPSPFTSGYGYGTTNTVRPGVIFVAENGYGVTPITASGDSSFGEAAFAVSSGAMYTALDYNFTFALKDALDNAAYGFVPGKGAVFTIIPTVKRREPSATPTTLHYNPADHKVYETYITSTNTYLDAVAGGETVALTASLWCGSSEVEGNLTVTQTAAGIKVTVPTSVTYQDTYTLKVHASYLGINYDNEFTLVCDNSTENVANYIRTLSTAGNYEVTLAGAVGSGTTADNEGELYKLATVIRAKSDSGIYITLDASATTMGSSFSSYNDGAYFKDCRALKEIKLPDWMKNVVKQLFEGCTNLESVTLSPNTQLIMENAFKGCSNLASITIPAGISGTGTESEPRGIQKGAFVNCKSGFSITYQGTKELWGQVKRSNQSVDSTKWHDGAKQSSASAGNVTCSGGSACGFDFKLIIGIPDATDLDEAPDPAIYPTLKVSSAEGFNRLAEWSDSSTDFQNITIILQSNVTVDENLSIKQFRGTFDGNNYAITQNFTFISNAVEPVTTIEGKQLYPGYESLFCSISTGAVIKNLTVKGNATKAGIVGCMFGGLIEDCVSEVAVSTSNDSQKLGGIVSNVSGSGTVRNCVFKGTIRTAYSGGGDSAGGIAGGIGSQNAVIENCINKGLICATSGNSPDGNKIRFSGGIVGYADQGVIRNCKNTNNVCGENAGGIAGTVESVSIINCSNTGLMIKFNGEAKPSGGIVGEYSQPWATLKNNCSVGGSDGGIIGYIASYNSEQAEASQPNSTAILSGNYYSSNSASRSVGGVNSDYAWSNIGWNLSCMNSYNAVSTSNTLESLFNFASNNSNDSVSYATWKSGSTGLELDLGDLDDK